MSLISQPWGGMSVRLLLTGSLLASLQIGCSAPDASSAPYVAAMATLDAASTTDTTDTTNTAKDVTLGDEQTSEPTTDTGAPNDAEADATKTGSCGGWGEPEKAGRLPTEVDEASGLVVSSFDADVLWTHNDGKDGKLYAVRASTGSLVATVALSGLSESKRDWEDLAAGPCGSQAPGKRCLYVADIGDNGKARKAVQIHRLIEPDPGAAPTTLSAYQTMVATYPGDKHNSEAAVVDATGKVWIFTKSNKTLRVYSATFLDGKVTWTTVTKFDRAAQMGGEASRVTGASWDPSGHRLVLRTHDTAWELCLDDAQLGGLLTAPWNQVKVAEEAQGEAIAYGDKVLWQVSEGGSARIRMLKR